MIRLRALGQCVVEVGDHHVTPESDVLFALLLFLSSSAGHAVPRADLLDLLWPGSSPRIARHRLRQALYQLKKLGAPLTTPDSVINLRESDVDIDYVACSRNRQTLAKSVCESRSLEFLPHYAPTFSEPFARWVEGERDRVRATLRRFLMDGITEKRAHGDHAEVIALARACLELDPLNGEATFALAESLAVRGSRGEALAILDQYRLDRRAYDDEESRTTLALRRRILEIARRPSPNLLHQGPIVGRSEILEELGAWIANGAKPSRILAFSGEAGIGKTRLLNEGTRIAGVRGMRCLEYRPGANGEERPLAGLLDLLPQLLALRGAVGCSPESYSRLTDLTRGVHGETSIPEDTTDSAFRFATLRRSVLDLIEAVLTEGELVLALDDAHALDRPTLEILLDATRCSGHPLAVMIAMRPVGATAAFLEARTDVRLIRVPRLNARDARAIVVQDLAPEVVAQRTPLIDWAVDLANGNPFFLVELSAHCGGESPSESLPESLQIVLDRKIDSLTGTARLVVQACAVLGENSTLARLEAMLALPPHAMAAGLSELELAGLIALRDGRVVCRHDLITDAVMRVVSVALGTYLHRRCASLLDDELQSSPAASLAWDCARHWDAAEEPTRALELTNVIVDRLLSLGLPADAADLCNHAERYCQTPVQHADRLLRLSRARRLLYDWEGVVSCLLQRHGLLANDRTRSRKYSDDEIALFEAMWWRDCDGQVLRPALQRVADVRAPVLHRLQMAVLALIVADNQHLREQADRIAEVVESLEVSTPREDVEKSKARLVYHTAFGSLDIAVTAGKRVVDAERKSGNSAALLKALRWLSLPKRLTNDIHGALTLLTEAYQHASRLGLRAEMWNACYYIEGVALDCEDLTLALEWAPVVGDLADDAIIHRLRASDYQYFMARIEYMRGDLEKARLFLYRSRDLKQSLLRARAEQSFLALDVLLRVRSNSRAIPQRLLERLYRLHLKSRNSGVLDFETAAIIAGFLHTGNRSQAQSLSDYYMQVRRSRIEKHSTLQSVQAELTR